MQKTTQKAQAREEVVSKLAPGIKKIIEQHNSGPINSLSQTSKFGQEDKTEVKSTDSFRDFKKDEKRVFKSRYACLQVEKDMFQPIETMNLLNEYPLEDKLRNIFNYHKQQAKKWKETFDKTRELNMPSILCRMCNRNFYADKLEVHNKNCYERNVKIQAQRDCNTEFITLSNLATEIIIQLERGNAM